MSFPCPKCNDLRTQSVPTAYESGTRVGSKGSGSQSIIAIRLAPPKKRRRWPKLLLLFVVPAAGAAFIGIFGETLGILLIPVLIAAILVWAFGSAARYNNTVWKEEMQAWQSYWVCNACSEIFRPQVSTVGQD